MNKKTHKRSSEILQEIAEKKYIKKKISYQEIIENLEQGSFGVGLLIFSLPSVLPFSMIPGFAVVLSIPLIIFAIQMIHGNKEVKLPEFFAKRKISIKKFIKLVNTTMPYLKVLEKPLKPRFSFMFKGMPRAITGILIILLSFLVMLPIPFTNSFFAFLILVFALAITEKDGLIILINSIVSIIVLILLIGLIIYLVLLPAGILK